MQHPQRAALPDPEAELYEGVPLGLDLETVSRVLREQVRDHPVRSMAIAVVSGLLVGKLLGRS